MSFLLSAAIAIIYHQFSIYPRTGRRLPRWAILRPSQKESRYRIKSISRVQGFQAALSISLCRAIYAGAVNGGYSTRSVLAEDFCSSWRDVAACGGSRTRQPPLRRSNFFAGSFWNGRRRRIFRWRRRPLPNGSDSRAVVSAMGIMAMVESAIGAVISPACQSRRISQQAPLRWVFFRPPGVRGPVLWTLWWSRAYFSAAGGAHPSRFVARKGGREDDPAKYLRRRTRRSRGGIFSWLSYSHSVETWGIRGANFERRLSCIFCWLGCRKYSIRCYEDSTASKWVISCYIRWIPYLRSPLSAVWAEDGFQIAGSRSRKIVENFSLRWA